MTSLDKHELLLTTREFEFTNNQVIFVRRLIQRKYPTSMSNLIDAVRGLMKLAQTKARTKMLYGAYHYTHEGSLRYHVSESLAEHQSESDKRFYIAIEPVPAEKKQIFHANSSRAGDADIAEVLAHLRDFQHQQMHFYQNAYTCAYVRLNDLMQEITSLLEQFQRELVVHEFEINFGEDPAFLLDLGHRATYSHHVRIQFDLLLP